MPKLKSHKGAAKRFTATKGGVKYRRANRNHILTKRSTTQKRRLRVAQKLLALCNAKMVKRLLLGS